MAKTQEDLKFEAEMDARTLAEAEVIKTTPSRMRRAKTAAKREAAKAEKQARGMRKVAGKKKVGKTRRKR